MLCMIIRMQRAAAYVTFLKVSAGYSGYAALPFYWYLSWFMSELHAYCVTQCWIGCCLCNFDFPLPLFIPISC